MKCSSENSLVRIKDYPQLSLIAWARPGTDFLTEEEALALYERNWIHVDKGSLLLPERTLIDKLILEYGNGHFLV